jgi:SPP1 family predicted phage head-tail adaptor
MYIKAGELDQRVVVQKPSGAVNDFNEPTGEWVEDFRAWAKVRPVRAQDVVDADRPWASGTYTFTVRACAAANALTATGARRIEWGGKHYYVTGEPMRLHGPRGFVQITATSVKVNDV